MTFITQKIFFDDFPSGGGHVYAKNVKKGQKSKKANILETSRTFCTFDHILQKADKFLKF